SDKVIIRITDNGIGMSKAEMSKIFSVDFSSNARANTLALAKVEQIVLLHNGTISVDSSEKAGTTFEIILPNNNII
ncbi:ATP-binding protein, partial [bacterium]|nr:ATP-binding protein [bacterium]